MPIYEYKCDDCSTVSEILVKNTENQSKVVCPNCRSGNLDKLISAPGAVMSKGGGFHGDLSDMPPAACPNQDRCGVPGGSCPAAQG